MYLVGRGNISFVGDGRAGNKSPEVLLSAAWLR